MRMLRDHQDRQSDPPTPQRSLEFLGDLWDEWEIHCLILISFGLQVFLFFASGLRRRSVSRILRLLLWLAYLSADSVAIFVLGHLALHANGARHQLLFFWAPFVLLHLGGQDTMNAFSMQDNELWTRHLLGLVTQVAAAGYVVSKTSWPDRRLMAAMLLMYWLLQVVEKSQLYSRADVAVSYVLLIGAVIFEAASLFISIQSYVSGLSITQGASKQWSGMLGQYNMIKSLSIVAPKGMMSFVPRWIGKHLDDKTSLIPISEDLKIFVLDALLDFGTREEDWNFASWRGQLALRNWTNGHEDSVFARPGSSLHKSIDDLDFPTSVLTWHIATDMLYYHEDISINSNQQTMKISRELSNYIMYLVFKCGAMFTSSIEFKHNTTRDSIKCHFGSCTTLSEKEAATLVFELYGLVHHRVPVAFSRSQPETQMQLLEKTMERLLPCAYGLAQELIDIHKEADCWDLVAAVWVEILYYIAPRCGGSFHSQHLGSGGEFITQVMLLMQLLGPFLPPPSA